MVSRYASSQIPGPKMYGSLYPFTFSWEENFDVDASLELLNRTKYLPLSIVAASYLLVLYVGQKLMSKREPFKLRVPLMLWNGGLALFSIIGFSRVFPEMYHSMTRFGFHHTICNNSFLNLRPAYFWIYLFTLSKTPELGDTLFLVLKKQKLTFLHVYHHTSVVLFSWHCLSAGVAASRWFCTMNYGVHSIMYSYYLLKAVPSIIKIPKSVSMLITTLQTIQMVMGAYVVGAAYYRKLVSGDCDTTTTMSISGAIIYLSYLALFSHFFYNSYCTSKPPRGSDDKKRHEMINTVFRETIKNK